MKCGVREYWVIDPETQTVRISLYEKDSMKDYSFSEKISVGIYGDLTIDFSEIK